MNFFLSYFVLAGIFAIATFSANLLMGVVGIFSVAQAAIMGIGAYTVAWMTMADVPFAVALVLGIGLCVIVNVIASLPALRLAGDYFVVTSFGIQLVATQVMINWASATGGAAGLSGIPVARIFGFDLETPASFVFLSTACLILVALSFWLLMRSPHGRILHAIRMDEQAVVAAGRSVLKAKTSAAAISGAYAGIAGGLYAAYLSFIDPLSFDIHVSILIVTMVVLGGARTMAGSIIGPFLLLAMPQFLALIDIPSSLAGPARQLIYGLLLVAFMIWRPQGIAGRSL